MNDDERLSALFEGRVVGRERDELLAHLAASDDDYEVFTDAAEVLRALEDEDALAAAASPIAAGASPGVPGEIRAEEGGALAEGSGVLPFRRPERAERRAPVRWPAMAAAAAVILLVSVFALRGRASSAPGPVQLASRVDGGLPEGWSDERPWVAERGGETIAERKVRAARAGVLMLDLALAVDARNTEQTRIIANQLRTRFDPGAGAGGPLEQIEERAGDAPESLHPLLEQATDRLENDAGDYFRLAAWAEAARLAARGQDEAFFRDVDTQAMLRRAEGWTRDDPEAYAAVGQVRTAFQADGPPVWEEREASLKNLLKEIAS